MYPLNHFASSPHKATGQGVLPYASSPGQFREYYNQSLELYQERQISALPIFRQQTARIVYVNHCPNDTLQREVHQYVVDMLSHIVQLMPNEIQFNKEP